MYLRHEVVHLPEQERQRQVEATLHPEVVRLPEQELQRQVELPLLREVARLLEQELLHQAGVAAVALHVVDKLNYGDLLVE